MNITKSFAAYLAVLPFANHLADIWYKEPPASPVYRLKFKARGIIAFDRTINWEFHKDPVANKEITALFLPEIQKIEDVLTKEQKKVI